MEVRGCARDECVTSKLICGRGCDRGALLPAPVCTCATNARQHSAVAMAMGTARGLRLTKVA